MRVLWVFLLFALLTLVSWMVLGGGFDERFGFDGLVVSMRARPVWGGLVGIGLLVVDILLPVPGTVVMSALGYVYGIWVGGLLAVVGSVGAGLAGYGIGRVLNESVARRFLGEGDYERGHRLFSRGGGWMVALSRSVPILPEAVAVTAGLVRMPFRKFLTALFCGSLPMGFTFAWIGVLGRDTPPVAILISMVLPIGLWLIARRWAA